MSLHFWKFHLWVGCLRRPFTLPIYALLCYNLMTLKVLVSPSFSSSIIILVFYWIKILSWSLSPRFASLWAHKREWRCALREQQHNVVAWADLAEASAIALLWWAQLEAGMQMCVCLCMFVCVCLSVCACLFVCVCVCAVPTFPCVFKRALHFVRM